MSPQEITTTSTKPYLVRALYEWILDNNMTPHLLVDVKYPGARVPLEFAENGQIVLNISPSAVQGLVMANDWVHFSARFGGVSRNLEFPSDAILGIFSRENHQGMIFPPPEQPESVATDSDQTARESEPARPIEPAKGERTPPGKGKGRGGPMLKIVK